MPVDKSNTLMASAALNVTLNNFLLLFIATSLNMASAFATGASPLPQSAADTHTGNSQQLKPGEVPTGLSGSDWSSIQAQITVGKYRAYQHNGDGFDFANPAHGWQIHFAPDGTTTLRSRDAQTDQTRSDQTHSDQAQANQPQAYHLGFKLSAIGYGELNSLEQPQSIKADAFTVTYQWNDNLREWWVNSSAGLEQWFELAQRPAGAAGGQPLRLEMALQSNLVASQHGNALTFVASGNATTISYSKLKAWDATGRELPARMQLRSNQLSLIN